MRFPQELRTYSRQMRNRLWKVKSIVHCVSRISEMKFVTDKFLIAMNTCDSDLTTETEIYNIFWLHTLGFL